MNESPRQADAGMPAQKFEFLFTKAGILTEQLEKAKSEKAKATLMGNFLTENTGREVKIAVRGRTGTARLRMEKGGGRAKRYFFEVRWDEPDAGEATPGQSVICPPLNDELPQAPERPATPGCESPPPETLPTPAVPADATGENRQAGVDHGNDEQW